MHALYLYYPPEVLAKLEKLAELTAYQEYTCSLLNGLDQARTLITQLFDAFFLPTEGYQKVDNYLFEHATYFFSGDYFERRARIAARGKETLLARFTTRFASK